MVHEPHFYIISSSDDEEDDHNQGRNRSPELSPDFLKVFDMDASDDDVVIIDKPTTTGNGKRDKARPIRSSLDDDECCMLDTDPGVTETIDSIPSLDSDELVMTGEKGPVACRDFPHARYLCVHYPFKATPHAKYCAQCHCYVCDSLAPCTLWGDGNNVNDHCHASEEPRWKTLRKLAKCGSVPSRAIPIPVASPVTVVPTTPTAASCPNLIGMGNSAIVNKFVQSGVLLDTSSTPPRSPSRNTQSPVTHPVGSGVPRQGQSVNSKVKKDPLVIKLRSKARGKPSQTPHLGVRSPRPVTGNRSALPSPRTASTHPSRTGDDILPPGVEPPQPPQFTSYTSPGAGRPGSGTVAGMPPYHSQSMPYKTAIGRAGGPSVMPAPVPLFSALAPPIPNNPPPGHFSRTTVNSNVVTSFFNASPPPLPNSPPPYIPPPPPSGPYSHSSPGAYDYPPPGVFNHNPVQLPGADATVAGFVPPLSHIPDSRYVSASALSAQQMICNVNTAPFYEGHSGPQPYDYVAQSYRSSVDSAYYPGSSYSLSNGGNADILAGATEGWVDDATAQFECFGGGIIGSAPDHDQHAASSLNDVLEQMAGDDYLWEQFAW